MSETMDKPDCYQCQYRHDLPWNHHSRCEHPGSGGSDNPFGDLIAILGKRLGPMPAPSEATVHVAGNPHGAAHGWFNWPFNFDPIWLLTCDGFTKKEG